MPLVHGCCLLTPVESLPHLLCRTQAQQLPGAGWALAWPCLECSPSGAFFGSGASGLVCTGRLLQNMLGLGCELKGEELFCTRLLPPALSCRKGLALLLCCQLG